MNIKFFLLIFFFYLKYYILIKLKYFSCDSIIYIMLTNFINSWSKNINKVINNVNIDIINE